MLTIEIDNRTREVNDLLTRINKQSDTVQNSYPEQQNIIPEGYMTADEWRTRCKKNISEIFRKYEQGIL
jgi:hypothetical protein